MRKQRDTATPMAVVVQGPTGWIALTPDELRTAKEWADTLGFNSANPATAPATAQSNPQALLTSTQLGKFLGTTPEWCEIAAKRGDIPSQRVGRYLRFDLAAVRIALACKP